VVKHFPGNSGMRSVASCGNDVCATLCACECRRRMLLCSLARKRLEVMLALVWLVV